MVQPKKTGHSNFVQDLKTCFEGLRQIVLHKIGALKQQVNVGWVVTLQ